MINKILVIGWLNLTILPFCFAQRASHTISPSETQPGIQVVHGPHWVFVPEFKFRKNKLIISIPGTGGSAAGLAAFDSVARLSGFHAISMDYKNEVITTVCRTSLDVNCFDSFRQEIIFGTPVSDSVKVDSINSLYNRIYRVLSFLNSHYPGEGWENYFRDGKVIWQNIVTAGHSQGAGHAAYLGMHFPVNKVIILAGPQDYLDHFKRPAPWISEKSVTPPNRFFALLHQLDPFGFDRQLASCLVLSRTQIRDTICLDAPRAIASRGNILVTHVKLSPHGSVANPVQANAWRYIFEK